MDQEKKGDIEKEMKKIEECFISLDIQQKESQPLYVKSSINQLSTPTTSNIVHPHPTIKLQTIESDITDEDDLTYSPSAEWCRNQDDEEFVNLDVPNLPSSSFINKSPSPNLLSSFFLPLPAAKNEVKSLTSNKKEYILLIGGYNGRFLDDVEIYDPQKQISSFLPSFSIARFSHDAVFLNDHIYIFGGYGEKGCLSSVEIYDFKLRYWSSGPSLLSPRSRHTSTIFDQKIFIIGGVNISNIPQNLVEIFDPFKLEWTVAPSLQYARCDHASVVCTNRLFAKRSPMHLSRSDDASVESADRIFVMGGYNGSKYLDSVEVFDFSVGHWQTLSTISMMPTNRSHFSAVSLSSFIYILGGIVDNSNSKSISQYDSIHYQYTEMSNLPSRLSRHRSEIINNHIYIIGGVDTVALSSVYDFNISKNKIYQLKDISKPRASHAIVKCDVSLIY